MATLRGSKPGLMVLASAKLLRNKPAPTSTTSASATATFTVAACSAGTKPATKVTARASTSVNRSTRQSSPASSRIVGTEVAGSSHTSEARIWSAKARPSTEPASASNRVSTSSWGEAAALGSQGQPDAELLGARGGARQQQIRDIGAGD